MKSYIVVFKESATYAEIEEYISRIKEDGGEIRYQYNSVMKGVAATMSDSLVNSFSQDPVVDFIEPDGVATTQDGAGVGI
ncbi:hypothetical protein BDV93DRAFT_518342 [Ceratobasidium sp. AG-I]|nr:hypothetical protein BDV93DRAFT_518342 [Ceratobasidium sp. AG-I]